MRRYIIFMLFLALLAVNACAAPINLGTASTFGLLAGSGITNVGSSVINGDVGSSPNAAVTGFPPGIVTPPHVLYTTPNAVTAQAQSDLTIAYNAAASATPATDLTGSDLGFFNAGNPLGPGIYSFSSSAMLTGNLTLDGQGDPNAQWIFKIGSSLTTATNASVSFINGASPCNVFWQVGSSAVIQTNTVFGGTIMALTSITLNGGTLHGRALARNGAVTISAAEFVSIDCPPGPRVTVAKVADRVTASVGDIITYTYAVANSGPVPLTINSVVDTVLGNLTADFITANGGTSTLAVGASTTFTETHTVLATDPNPLVNTVNVGATGNGVNVTANAQASVIITTPGPKVTIEKTANKLVAAAGDLVTYTYKVVNGGTAPLTINSVIDSRLGNITADFIIANGGTAILAAGASASFIKVYTVLVTDSSPLTNVATVTASSGGVTVVGVDDASVIISTPGPSVTLVKTADVTSAQVGDIVTYTFAVANSGATPLTVNSVIDSHLGDLTADFVAANLGSNILAPGATRSFIKVYTILATDTTPLTNVATVNASSGGVIVTDQGEATVIIVTPAPGVIITKTADRTVASVGDIITYTFTVCNSGPLPMTVNSVIDSHLGDLTAYFKAANGGSLILASGACATFTRTFKVTDTAVSPLVNSVTVNGCSGGTPVTNTTQVSVTISRGRQCFQPVTLTQQGWHKFCSPALGLPGGLVYNAFPLAFAKYGFFGTMYSGRVIIGAPKNIVTAGEHSLTFTGTTANLTKLCNFLPQVGPADRLWGKYTNPNYLVNMYGVRTSNILAGEVLALTLNIGYNDMRLMPRSRGFDLEKFTLTKGLFKDMTVGQVWNIADAVLSGADPLAYGLPNMAELVSILQSINANYEFVDINTFIDRGYLKPNIPLIGLAGPAHPMIVPF